MSKKFPFPSRLADSDGKSPTTAAQVMPESADLWVACWATKFAIAPAEGERVEYEWSDFEGATWDDDADLLAITFIDSRIPQLRFVLSPDADPLVLTMIRERVERSLVFQQFRELPSGAVARGLVRRNADESLFSQILVSGTVTAADQAELDALDVEIRDAVGLD